MRAKNPDKKRVPVDYIPSGYEMLHKRETYWERQGKNAEFVLRERVRSSGSEVVRLYLFHGCRKILKAFFLAQRGLQRMDGRMRSFQFFRMTFIPRHFRIEVFYAEKLIFCQFQQGLELLGR